MGGSIYLFTFIEVQWMSVFFRNVYQGRLLMPWLMALHTAAPTGLIRLFAFKERENIYKDEREI